ncbi:biotin--[acetyl-CoA-carboxylase] ligase [Aeromicrobium sp. Leaf350]|uniref:biotin--[acetyl-CoA-carboxylase] ligase n=1 Tax=Aeromicrobium sp. Leaf350 TaxID=2876565 RepID=UPI001E30A5C9|nr:biotin--[acetyl-CoA-carboxylase] ligase [Aeromicrobium sp. Leaf350]
MDAHLSRGSLDATALEAALSGQYAEIRVLVETGSTNADAAQWAREGAPHGSVVTADHQLAGRGRLDRSFTLPERSGIAVSVVWRPEVPLRHWVWLPLAAGLALDATLVELGVHGRLKWPNDVLVDGRKISGILLERVETPGAGSAAAAVVGIGLNVDLTDDELPVPHATSLRIAGAADLDRGRVLALLLHHLDLAYERWRTGDAATLRADYVARCDTVGRVVDVAMPDGSVLQGTAEDVDVDGRLVVAGTAVSAGDVTHVRARA